jgi:high-affinity Fe2+/Pb2+ permease
MEITQILVFVVIAVELVLIFISLYLYNSYKVRIFYFLTWGFVALLLSYVIQGFLTGNTIVYSNVLDIAAGLFFVTSALTAV